ncbi:MAG TPA: MFS transporter [Rhodanobacteraceae bacterium]|jgi:MFS family permease|nr:MFS transporter [Rhodanobacteraceae bacterium]
MRRTRSDAPEPGSRWFNATLGLLALAVFIGAVDRGNLATAAPLIKDELHFSATRLGFLLAAYYITYVPAQIVVGWLVDRVGAARVLATGFVAWSLAMSLTGAAHGFATMVWLRLALGIGEAAFMPAASAIVARCFPETGRGTANGVVLAGLACGPAFGVFFGGMLIAAIGWRAFFIGFGLASVAWLLPWLALVRPRLVERHPAASAAAPDTFAILRERSLWGASIGHFCGNYAYSFVLSWIPYYLVHDRGWSLAQMATIGGSAYLLMALSSLVTGRVADRMIAAGGSATRVRKTCLAGGYVLATIFVTGCAMASANISVLLLLLTCAAFGLVAPNLFAVAQSLAGADAAGRWVGIQVAIGNAPGLVAPFLTGILVDHTGSFMVPFVVAGVVQLAGAVAWVFGVGPVAPIDWARRRRISAPPSPPMVLRG